MKYIGLIINDQVVLDYLTRKQVHRALGVKPCQKAAFPDCVEGPGRRFYFCDMKAMATDAFRYATRNQN